jgi:DNA-binding NarL/FixJ family response regulator
MKTLAIVDARADDRNYLMQCIEALESWRIIGVCDNFEDAIDCIISHQPELVITDAFLFGVSGIELSKWIKTNRPTIKVVLMSTQKSYAIELYHEQLDGFLMKPFDENNVITLLRKF